ncbi:MAG TPA: hypothetical protein VGM19_01800 [Armatimonadota bacterium]
MGSKRLWVLVVGAMVLARPSFSAGEFSVQAEIRGTFTDNVFLEPKGKSDFITRESVGLRQTLLSEHGAKLSLKADFRRFDWAQGSFEGYTYSQIGLDYNKRLGRARALSFGYAYLTNDSFDADAPFHRFQGHRLFVSYELPMSRRSSLEARAVVGTRRYGPGEEGRNGTGQSVGLTWTTPWDERTRTQLLALYENEGTRDPSRAWDRYSVAGSVRRYLRRSTEGPWMELGYTHRYRAFRATTRKDNRDILGLKLTYPIGRDKSLWVGANSIDNDSTHANHTYQEHDLEFGLLGRF